MSPLVDQRVVVERARGAMSVDREPMQHAMQQPSFSDPSIGQDAGADRLRFVARFINGLVLARLSRWPVALGCDAADALLVQAMLALTLPPARPGMAAAPLDAPDPVRLSVPLAALAQATGLSYETVRRRAARLRKAGLIGHHGEGFTIPAATLGTPAWVQAMREDRAALLAMLTAMEAQGLRITAAALAAHAVSPGRIARLELDFAMRCIEEVVAFDGGVVPGTIRLAIAHANTRHLLDDPATSLRYAHEDRPLPDDARRAIGPRGVSRETGLPFETVRRHVAAMLAAGTIALADGGVILPARALMVPAHVTHQRRLIAHFRRLIGELAPMAG